VTDFKLAEGFDPKACEIAAIAEAKPTLDRAHPSTKNPS